MLDLQIDNTPELSDQYALLRSHVERQLKMGSDTCATIVVTSYERGEGVSSVVLNMAMAFSQGSAARILVVDAKPNNIARLKTMQKLWKNNGDSQPADPGTEIIETGRPGYGENQMIRADGNFDIILVQGKQNGRNSYFRPDSFRMFLEKAREEYNVILVDAPAIRENSFTQLVAPGADGVIIVVEAGRVRREVLKRAMEELQKTGATMLGIVLNKQRYPIPEFIYRWI